MSGDERRTAEETFSASTLTNGWVRFTVRGREVETEMDMAPESARWLAHQLILASRLPYPPPLRFTRRSGGAA